MYSVCGCFERHFIIIIIIIIITTCHKNIDLVKHKILQYN